MDDCVPNGALGSSPAAPTSANGAGEAVGKISAERLATSGKRGAGALILLAVAAATGGWYVWQGGGGAPEEELTQEVEAVPGNLVADASFEGENDEWESADAPAAFFRDGVFAESGASGFGVDLEADGWALARSPWAAFPRAGLSLAVAARVEPDGSQGTRVRAGIQLSSSEEEAPAWTAWTQTAAPDEFLELALTVAHLPGYDRARVVLAAKGAGRAVFDDVALVPASAAAPSASFHEYAAHASEGAASFAMSRAGRSVLTASLDTWGSGGLEGWPEAKWSATAGEKGFAISAGQAPSGAMLQLAIHAPKGAAEELWLATIGADGYAAHGGAVNATAVDTLLFGRGSELVRIGFPAPVDLRGAMADFALRLRVGPLSGASADFDVQLSFSEERARAVALSQKARQAERDNEIGAAIAGWRELLDRYPFDGELVREGETAFARLIEAGQVELEAWQTELERARFFRLPELYRACGDGFTSLAARYAGTSLEAEAQALAAEVEEALSEVADSSSEASGLIGGVLEALDSEASPKLYEHLRSALSERGPQD